MHDQPTDAPHLCVTFESKDEKRIRCLDKAFENGVVKVVKDKKKKGEDGPHPTPTVLVAVEY